MVLRGSETLPDNALFQTIAGDLRKAMEALESAENQLAGRSMAMPKEPEGSQGYYLTKDEFFKKFAELNARLELLDNKIAAERSVKQATGEFKACSVSALLWWNGGCLFSFNSCAY